MFRRSMILGLRFIRRKEDSAVDIGSIENGHPHVRSGQRRQTAGYEDVLFGCTVDMRGLKAKLFALVLRTEPVPRESAQLESRLAVELTIAEHDRECGKKGFGFLYGLEVSPSYSAGLEFELTGVAQNVELA
jgi:hypothetical protein